MSDMNFEETMASLREMSEKIKDPSISLEDSVKCFDAGMEYYKRCVEILDNAKQKIEVFEGEVLK